MGKDIQVAAGTGEKNLKEQVGTKIFLVLLWPAALSQGQLDISSWKVAPQNQPVHIQATPQTKTAHWSTCFPSI